LISVDNHRITCCTSATDFSDFLYYYGPILAAVEISAILTVSQIVCVRNQLLPSNSMQCCHLQVVSVTLVTRTKTKNKRPTVTSSLRSDAVADSEESPRKSLNEIYYL